MPMASVKRRPDGAWRARYRDLDGREHARHFSRKVDAQAWLDERTTALVTGTHVDPKTARTTVKDWCETWLAGYGTRRPSTVRQARVHVAQIVAEFGSLPLVAVRPSNVRAWCTKLGERGYATSTIYALHARLAQIMSDAVHDGIVPRSPCSRRTSPPMAKQRPYVATVDQVWALHDAMPDELRPAILLGAFAGLRVAEVCGLRVPDVDFMRGVITPALQYPEEPLKTEISRTPIPIPRSLANTLAAHVGRFHAEHVLVGEAGVRLAARPVGVGASRPHRARRCRRAAGRVPVPRPEALLRLVVDRQRGERQGGPGPAPARLGEHDAGHLQPSVAGLRRVDQDRDRGGPGRSCGLSADSGGDRLTN
jgi:integrase